MRDEDEFINLNADYNEALYEEDQRLYMKRRAELESDIDHFNPSRGEWTLDDCEVEFVARLCIWLETAGAEDLSEFISEIHQSNHGNIKRMTSATLLNKIIDPTAQTAQGWEIFEREIKLAWDVYRRNKKNNIKAIYERPPSKNNAEGSNDPTSFAPLQATSQPPLPEPRGICAD